MSTGPHGIHGRTALITGAASGIGRELALQLAALGVRIAALDLDPAGLASLAAALDGRPAVHAGEVADVTDRAALAAAVRSLEARIGPIDLLVASAGLGSAASALRFDAAEIDRIIRVNLIGVSNSIGAVVPGMLARGGGHLVALSSLASYRGFPLMAAYCASKAGVNALMESLRLELVPRGITCTTVCPGWVRTPMLLGARETARALGGARVSDREMMDVTTAARRIVRAIRNREVTVSFPRQGAWLAWFMRTMPATVADGWLRKAGLNRRRDKR